MIRTQIAKEIWNKKYRNNNESEENMYHRVAHGLFSDEFKANLLKELLSEHKFFTAGRGMFGIGTDKTKQTFSNCFVHHLPGDSMEAIFDTAKDAAITMKAGGGVGYPFGILRPKAATVSTSKSESSGVVSFMRIYDTACATIKAGGSRQGAQMGALPVWHPDIEEFITCKQDGSLSNFNLSVFISDKFMKAVEKDKNWKLVFPDTSFEKYDQEWNGNLNAWMEKEYPVKTYKTIKARDLWTLITKSNYDFAEPGILFEDTINNNNTLKGIEYIQVTNPCGEQPLPNNGSCNLGSLNLYNHVKNPFTEDAEFDLDGFNNNISIAVEALDNMLDINYMPHKKQAQEMIAKRPIGLGVTGLADCLAALGLKYSSQEARDFVDEIGWNLFNTAYLASAGLAKTKGEFPYWDLDRFKSTPFWNKLEYNVQEEIMKYGLRNSRLLSIAPTGTISLVMNNVSGGIEPFFSLEYDRQVLQPDGSKKTEAIETLAWHDYKKLVNWKKGMPIPEAFETAQDLSVDAHLEMQAVWQKWICTSISKTINVPVDYPFEEFQDIYIKGWKLGLKGCTTYRPNSIVGSVLEVKTEEKEQKKSIKKEQKEFFDAWKDIDGEKVIIEDISLPSEYPMVGYKVVSEGKKYYIHVPFKDKQAKTTPFAVFIQTNHHESDVNTYTAKEMLVSLAAREGIPERHIEKTIQKSAGQNNITKLARLLSLLLRHNVQINKIVKALDACDVPVSSFVFRIKKFLMRWVEEIENGAKCPECDDTLVYKDGCVTCETCFWSKCA